VQRSFAILIAALVMLPVPSMAQSTAAVDVVLDSGWTYRNVTVTLLDDGESVEVVRQDGASLVLPIASVSAVYDADGQDVTAAALGVERSPARRGTFNELGGSNEPPPAPVQRPGPRKRSFSVMLSAGAGYGLPVLDFYEGLDPGLVLFADLRINVSPLRYLKFSYRTQNLFNESLQIDMVDGYSELIETSLDLRQYLLSYGFLSAPAVGKRTIGYGEIGIGYGDHVLSASYQGDSASISVGRFLIVGQGGALVPFGKDSNVGLDLGAYVVAKLVSEEEGEGIGLVFGVQAGLTVAFGRGS
jgi:hypothetical protein